jgi:hypothetical protein
MSAWVECRSEVAAARGDRRMQGGRVMTDPTRDHRTLDDAIQAFDSALAALLDAEQCHIDRAATLALADQVIAARLHAYDEMLCIGWVPPAQLAHDIVIDREITALAAR